MLQVITNVTTRNYTLVSEGKGSLVVSHPLFDIVPNSTVPLTVSLYNAFGSVVASNKTVLGKYYLL